MNDFTPDTQNRRLQYMQATGDLPYPLTNDYMFKALLQKNENALKHLICSLLHLRPEEVERVEIKNPIVLGEAITASLDSRLFVLDINVLLDNRALINLATQEDREWKTDYWASLFKATTWEELKMLAKQSAVLEDAVETIYELTADESIREQCKAREKYVREVNTVLSERDMAIQARDEMRQERDGMRQARDDMRQERDDMRQKIDQLLQEIERLKNR